MIEVNIRIINLIKKKLSRRKKFPVLIAKVGTNVRYLRWLHRAVTNVKKPVTGAKF